MIVKNEEDTLARCLSCAKDIVDEIIIVDTGSTDATKKIAEKYTDKIYDFQWIDDFSMARNFSFSKATKDYILWLDADDIITREDVRKFIELKAIIDPSVDAVMMKYIGGIDAQGNVTFSYYRERLVKRSNNFKWVDPVHEYIMTSGHIISSDTAITHNKVNATPTDRNLKIFNKMKAAGKEFSPRNIFYYARELYYKHQFSDAIIYLNKFLDTNEGWIEDNINACFHLSICYDHQKDRENMLKALFRSFEYDLPRAEICCQIAYYYIQQEDYKKAVFWYELATRLKKPMESWGFILHDYWDYIPYIQLCVCHDRLGNREEAIRYNNMVLEKRPNDQSALYNKNYFESLQNK